MMQNAMFIMLCIALIVPGGFVGIVAYKVIKHFLDAMAKAKAKKARRKQ